MSFFLLFKMQFVYNSNVFGSCFIHVLYTECAKIQKNNSGAKSLRLFGCDIWVFHASVLYSSLSFSLCSSSFICFGFSRFPPRFFTVSFYLRIIDGIPEQFRLDFLFLWFVSSFLCYLCIHSTILIALFYIYN